MQVLTTGDSTGQRDHSVPPPVLLDRVLLPHLVCRRDKRQSREVIWGTELQVARPSGKQLGVVVFMPTPQEEMDRVRHSGGRSQTGWARAAKPMSKDMEVPLQGRQQGCQRGEAGQRHKFLRMEPNMD